MKKSIILLGILAVTLIFSLTGCKGSSAGGSGGDDPALTGTVNISGTAEVGETLTADTSALDGDGTISYQWKRSDTVVGTNSSTYLVDAADTGAVITVTVTRAGYSGSVTSLPTAAVIDPNLPALTGIVSISGDAVVGETLTAVTTALGGSGTIAYQWKRDGQVVGTGSSYEVQAADYDFTITVTVTRSGNSGSVTSDPTVAVIDPNITGTANITVTFDGADAQVEDPDSLIVDGVLTMNRGDVSVTLSLADSDDYDSGSIKWQVQNTAVSGSGADFELDASNPVYLTGMEYFVTVEAQKGGVPFNHTITFKVEEE